MTRTSREEQETVARWDQTTKVVSLCTSAPPVMRKWKRLGYEVTVLSRDRAGRDRTWVAEIPLHALTFRRLAPASRTRAGRPVFVQKPPSGAGSVPGTGTGQPAGPVATPGARNPADSTRGT